MIKSERSVNGIESGEIDGDNSDRFWMYTLRDVCLSVIHDEEEHEYKLVWLIMSCMYSGV